MKKIIFLVILGLLLTGIVVAQIKITATVQENECNKCLKTCEEVCK